MDPLSKRVSACFPLKQPIASRHVENTAGDQAANRCTKSLRETGHASDKAEPLEPKRFRGYERQEHQRGRDRQTINYYEEDNDGDAGSEEGQRGANGLN